MLSRKAHSDRLVKICLCFQHIGSYTMIATYRTLTLLEKTSLMVSPSIGYLDNYLLNMQIVAEY